MGGPANEEAWGVEVAADGTVIVAGYTESYGAGGADMFVLGFDTTGSYLWGSTAGGLSFDYGEALALTSDGGFGLAGATFSWGFGGWDLLVSNFDGALTCVGGATNPSVGTPSVVVLSPGPTGTILSPTTSSPSVTLNSPTLSDTLVCYTTGTGVGEGGAGAALKLRYGAEGFSFTLPGAGRVTLSVYDPSGRLATRPLDGWVNAGWHTAVVSLPTGVYIAELSWAGGVTRSKAVVW